MKNFKGTAVLDGIITITFDSEKDFAGKELAYFDYVFTGDNTAEVCGKIYLIDGTTRLFTASVNHALFTAYNTSIHNVWIKYIRGLFTESSFEMTKHEIQNEYALKALKYNLPELAREILMN